MKFFDFMSQGWGVLTPRSVPRGGFLYTMIVPEGGFLLPSSRVPGEGMVLDEIDTCITAQSVNKCLTLFDEYCCEGRFIPLELDFVFPDTIFGENEDPTV